MAFILAPYNNAMRLGQGFNTYTQQICIDDAVIVDPKRPENIVTNDGTTMRIMVQTLGKPSAWSRQREVVIDDDVPNLVVKSGIPENKNPKPTGDASSGLSKSPASQQLQLSDTNADDSTDTPDAGDLDEVDFVPTDQDPSEEALLEDTDTTGESGHMVELDDAPADDVKAAEQKGKTKSTSESPKAAASTTQPSPVNKRTRAVKHVMAANVIAKSKSQMEEQALLKEDRERVREELQDRKQREADKRDDDKRRQAEERERKDRELELRREIEKERWEEAKQLRAEARKQRQEDAQYKRELELARQKEQQANIKDAAGIKNYNAEERAAMKAEMDVVFEDRFKGMVENQKLFDFDDASAGGPSQTVTYTSRFVDKLSDITDDMNISGSLSIKAGKFGGSGRGSFIDSDKFKESDLNFYISVKVVNQTINFKDALIYNPTRSVDKSNFNAVFGDGFISGFQEGGEFNALVSMKILNKAKKTDIQAEAKVAFTTGAVDIKAEANVNIAKANIETNTETTIQVSWSGGGHIKPREQQWDVHSLMQAASRFPDLVAQYPQRIYAIITKYESLRSFVALKPAGYTKLQYENAQIYSNAMMDSYMSYKSLYTKIGSQIFDVQSKTKKIKAWEGSDLDTDKSSQITKTATDPSVAEATTSDHDTSKFPASLTGLAAAKKVIRRQMNLIVNEVDEIEKDPRKATEPDHKEPFQDPVTFEERLPAVEAPLSGKSVMPLSGQRIQAKTKKDKADGEEDPEDEEQLSVLIADPESLSSDEKAAVESLQAARPAIGKNLRITPAQGSDSRGSAFNNLEFLQPDWSITVVKVEIFSGAISGLWLHFDNGVIISRGTLKGGRLFELTNFQSGEKITAGSVQIGKGPESTEDQIIALQIYTNRGRHLIAQATASSVDGDRHVRDGVEYTGVKTIFIDSPLVGGNLKGFYGRADEKAIWRLGFIWGDLSKVGTASETDFDDTTSFLADPITEAKNEAGKVRVELQQVQKQLEDTKRELSKQLEDTKRELSKQVEDTKRDWTTESTQLRRDLDVSRSQIITDARWSRGRIEIFYIVWGGILITEDRIGQEMMDRMENRSIWNIESLTMGGNTWSGVDKSGTIVYRYDKRGPVRCWNGRQDQRAPPFDAL